MAGCATLNKTELTSEDLHTTLERLATKNNICAVTLAVIKNRKIDSIDSATGCQPALTLNPDSIFQAASLGKPVFAFAVLKLVDQGILELDTPVVKYLPQGYLHLSNPFETKPSLEDDLVSDPRFQAVTVRMVLNHTSGLPNWAHGPLSFESAPGTEWHYSGEGYLLLQCAVEAVTGESLDQLMITQVFKPLGMTHSEYIWSPRLDRNLVPAMTADGIATKPWHFKTSIAAATLYTSVEDYAKFVANVLNDDHLLKQLTKSPVTVEPRLNLSWGLGWGIERSEGDLFIWHWGNNPGYRTFVMASVQSGDGIIMFTNSDNGLALAEPIANKVLSSSGHKVFQFYMLRDGLAYFMCEALGFCI
jgi:CubicO group peptidase (beta-lactamase class C family)